MGRTGDGGGLKRVLLSGVGLCVLVAGCTSNPAVVSTHDSAQPASVPVMSRTLEEARQFDIPAGDARSTLNEFSRQSNVQMLFDFTALSGRQTAAVDRPRRRLRQCFRAPG